MSDAVSILARGERALASENYGSFRTILTELQAHYRERIVAERMFIERAKAISLRDDPSVFTGDRSEVSPVQQSVLVGQKVSAVRAGALFGIGSSLPALEGDLDSFITTLKAAEEEFEAAKQNVTETVEETSLGSLPRIYELRFPSEPLGVRPFELEVHLGNAGDVRSDVVSVTVAIPDLGIDNRSRKVQLAPKSSTIETFPIKPDTSGSFQIEASIETPEGPLSQINSVELLDAGSALERATSFIEVLARHIDQTITNPALKQEMKPLIDTTQQHCNEARRVLERYPDLAKSHLAICQQQLTEADAILSVGTGSDSPCAGSGHPSPDGLVRIGLRSTIEDSQALISLAQESLEGNRTGDSQ